MSFELVLGLLTLFGTAAIGMPVAYAIIIGVLVYLGLAGQDLAIAGETMVQRLFDGFLLLAVPLFIVSANIMNAGSISDRLLKFCIALVGRFRGGLGHVNVVASLIFSGMSGSAVADAAGIGKLIIDMMVKSGKYSRGYAAAITAATATIGPIIPPSIPLVLYALVSDTSIASLFLGGIVPGLIMAGVLMGTNAWIAHKRDFGEEEAVPLIQLPRITLNATPALLMPVILLTCIYTGVTTPTEAAAIAAFYALLVSAFLYRTLKFMTLYEVFVESAKSAAAVGVVIGASMILMYVVIQENIPVMISEMMAGSDISPLTFLLLVNLLVLLLGCVLDATVIILVIVPLFIPTCNALGIDLIHFGVLIVVNSMIGLITPVWNSFVRHQRRESDTPKGDDPGDLAILRNPRGGLSDNDSFPRHRPLGTAVTGLLMRFFIR